MSKYEVNWISPRGFSNEGDYVYGTTEELAEEIDGLSADNLRWNVVSKHRTLESARDAAIASARRDRRRSAESELCAIGAREAGKEPDSADQYAVLYNQ